MNIAGQLGQLGKDMNSVNPPQLALSFERMNSAIEWLEKMEKEIRMKVEMISPMPEEMQMPIVEEAQIKQQAVKALSVMDLIDSYNHKLECINLSLDKTIQHFNKLI